MRGEDTHQRLQAVNGSLQARLEETARSSAEHGGESKDLTYFLVDVKNGSRFPLRGYRLIIGRSNVNHIEVKDSSVSRVHAVITLEDGQYFLDDLGSSNGTFLNGSPVIRRQPLSDRDTIRLGESIFTFVQRTRTANREETKKLLHL